jgi:hypothetical protein
VGAEIDTALGINFFFRYSQKWAYLYFLNKTIAHWSMPVGQFLRDLQTRGAFIAAFTSEKR